MRFIIIIIISLFSLNAFSFEFFTYHDWCEYKLNSDVKWDATRRAFSLSDYKAYLEKSADCHNLIYISYKYQPLIFEFAFMHSLLKNDDYEPLVFLKKLDKYDGDISTLRYSGLYYLFERNPKTLSDEILAIKDRLTRYECEQNSDCYSYFLDMLGVKSFAYFSSISEENKRRGQESLNNFDIDLEKQSCYMHANIMHASEWLDKGKADYANYQNILKICNYFYSDIFYTNPLGILNLMEHNYFSSEYQFDDFDNVLKELPEFKFSDYFPAFEQDNYAVNYRARDFVFRYYPGVIEEIADDFHQYFLSDPLYTLDSFLTVLRV